MTKTIKRIHLRIAIGGVILMVALAAWVFGFGGNAFIGGAAR